MDLQARDGNRFAMMKLQGTLFNLDAVKDQIAKVLKRDALNDPARVRKELSLNSASGTFPGPYSA
jgi:hypothetical protein